MASGLQKMRDRNAALLRHGRMRRYVPEMLCAPMIVLTLPFPISVNAMYADGKTRRHKSQRYADWLAEAGYALKSQRAKTVLGPVTLLYEVQEGKDNRRRDIGNLEKGCTDLLVEYGVIEADHDRIVREIRLVWNKDVQGVRVTVASASIPTAGEENVRDRTQQHRAA
jgi:Holliday junction resolvase RusA-like endonuclease